MPALCVTRSVSEPLDRDWSLYVGDMVRFAENVLAYSAGLDQAGFVEARVVYDACLRNLELLGEAATHVPDTVRASYPSIPWRLFEKDVVAGGRGSD